MLGLRSICGLALIVLLALPAAAGAAGQKGKQTYTDAHNDSRTDRTGRTVSVFTDIRGVTVANDDAGTITFEIDTMATCTPPGDARLMCGGQALSLGLDTDRNGATGSGTRSEFLVVWDDQGSRIRAWSGTAFADLPVQATTGRLGAGRFGYVPTVKAADIASPRSFDFYVGGFSATAGETAVDVAPESGRFTYLVRIAPTVRALASSGQRGNTVRLRYRVSDESGQSQETITVYRGKARVAIVRGRLGDAQAGRITTCGGACRRS